MSSSVMRPLLMFLTLQGFAQGCSGSPSAIDFGPEQQSLGRKLTPDRNPGRAAWSADSREIYYLSVSVEEEVDLLAIDVETDRSRPLAVVAARNFGREHVMASDDGRFVYFSATHADAHLSEVLYRVPASGGAAVEVSDSLAHPWFTVSSDGSRAAFVSRDPGGDPSQEWLTLLDEADTSTPVARLFANVGPPLGAGAPPFSFSPDESLLVFSSVITWLYGVRRVILAFPDGRLQTLLEPRWSASDEEIAGLDVHWSGNTPHILVATSTSMHPGVDLFDIDASSGARTRLGPPLEGEAGPWALTWSKDGGTIAAWVPVEVGPVACSGEGACINRRLVHWRLYLLPRHEETPEILAETVSSEGVGWLSFSPDGRWLGYMLNARLYVHRLH